MSRDQRSILICWVGLTDINASKGVEKAGLGPVANAVMARDYKQVILLSNLPGNDSKNYLAWVKEPAKSDDITLKQVKLTEPTNFGEIYEIATTHIKEILEEQGESVPLTYHLSPGTPAMAAVWIILAKTRFAAELIESSIEKGVRTAKVPFDISAEFIPDLYKRLDNDLVKLTAGVPKDDPAFSDIIHRSKAMKLVIAKAQRIAPRSIPVLIEGESGTGKELMARAIHKASTRKEKPFVAVNCGAIAPEIVESEFFGHKKGAFTGAASDRKGHFEMAEGGTLFLDEIGELPLEMQVKLLRVLQENKITRLGTSGEINVNVRIIAATNRTLSHEVAEERFREDIFYRIAVGIIPLPPLRERKGDIGILIDHLLSVINKESAAEPDWKEKNISVNARNILLANKWKGNIRELQNTLTRAIVWSTGTTITKNDIEGSLMEIPSKGKLDEGILNKTITEGIDLEEIIGRVVRHYITRALKEKNNNKSKAAELLGLKSYQTLKNWMAKYRIEN